MNTDCFAISGGGLSAIILPHGARLADLRMNGSDSPLVLRYNDMSDFLSDRLFMGAVIGRFGNRIQNGRVHINGTVHELEKNEADCRHLHGGTNGFSSKTWHVQSCTEQSIQLRLFSADGEAGFPGNLNTLASYSIPEDGVLRLDLEATTDRETIINLCHHPYFNLDQTPDLNGHRLTINTSSYLPCGKDLVPTGEIRSVDSSAFDFRIARPLLPAKPESATDFNNTYCLPVNRKRQLYHAATLSTEAIQMQLWTSQPGLHLYNSYKLDGSAIGFNGTRLQAGAGLCLEAQGWPDSPNQANFPSCRLLPGMTYFHRTEYRFKTLHDRPE